jgi:hypothetical protein
MDAGGLIITMTLKHPNNTVILNDDTVVTLYRCHDTGNLKLRFVSLTDAQMKVERLKHVIQRGHL